MGELTFKSPGVSTREIDLSGPRRQGPTGIPAGVIGTSLKGRAFVPLVFANFSDFASEFGGVSADQFGPMALREWFENARSGLFLKVLGVGDGKARLSAPGPDSRGESLPIGSVKNAGFVVGQKEVNPASGRVEDNPYAGTAVKAARASLVIPFTNAAAPVQDNTLKLISVDANGTQVTKTYQFRDSGQEGGVDAGNVAVTVGANADASFNNLKTAINSANGNNANVVNSKLEIIFTVEDPNNAGTFELKQVAPGKAGNTLVAGTIGGATIPPSFTGGKDANTVAGRTYFLGCLTKEVAEVASTAKLSYTANPSPGKTIKLISSDKTEKLYVMGANDDLRQAGGAISNADVLALGDQVGGVALQAGDARIGGIHVEIGANADATYANLKSAINNTAHHSLRITITHAVEGDANVGDFSMAQISKGREGNTIITSDLDNVTVPAAFVGGKGFRVLSEAGAGKASSTTGIKYAPLLRGVLMVPSGVVPSLSASRAEVLNNTPVGLTGLSAPSARTTVELKNAVPADTDKITIIDSAGVSKIYEFDTGNGLATGGAIAVEIGDGGSLSENLAASIVNLKAAIMGATGHNGSIIATIDANSPTVLSLRMKAGGLAGNTEVTPAFTTGANVVASHFSGGQSSPGILAASSEGFGPVRGYDNGGSAFGAVNTHAARQEFVMLLNGHKSSVTYPSVVTASFDPMSSNYFPKLLNTDPSAIQEAGHCLYTHYDVFGAYGLPDGSDDNPLIRAGYASRNKTATGDGSEQGAHGPNNSLPAHKRNDIAFLFPSSTNRARGASDSPNTENFRDRFRTAKTPTVISQKFGGENKDLFKIHSLDDGAGGNTVFKISIENIRPSKSSRGGYTSFDLNVRSFDDNDREPLVLESFKAINLDPHSDRYIARVIGDKRWFYDFDKQPGSQKGTQSGTFDNVSRHIRVEVSDAVSRKDASLETAMPVGFRGMPKLNIDNGVIFASSQPSVGSEPVLALAFNPSVSGGTKVTTPPLGLRRSLGLGQVPKKKAEVSLHWGVQFEADDQGSEPNKGTRHASHMSSLGKYFPDFDQSGDLVLLGEESTASDSYNNNKFTLENIQIIEDAAGNPDSQEWPQALYQRDGSLDVAIKDIDGNDASGKSRFLNTTSDFKLSSARKFLKFTFFAQGGFDGFNIFDSEKSKMTDVAVLREVEDTASQGGKFGPTAASYMKAVDVLAEKTDVDVQLLAIPGIRQPVVMDRAIEAVEDRFDAMLIMDTVPYDFDALPVTGSTQKVSVNQTVSKFSNRVLDTSFAAAYFPDVVISDSQTGQNIAVPPTVPVLGAFSLNDRLAHPWFAPAGFTRGSMTNVLESKVKLNRDNLDSLYEADINPLTSFPHSEGVIVFGQKTLLRTQSSLDRVNVRRLLIEIRRRVKSVANSFIFEPNRESTLARFSARVNPILKQIQQQQGVERFLVKIDTSTTTDVDVENNTLRGKIFLQPTRSVEFVSLDFVVTNAGAEI